ncbi:MAG: hypothetical protein JSS75_12475 [Bacteroidetes bacterium]|nr:hypothetical protein [Bacteroidota bacterium]
MNLASRLALFLVLGVILYGCSSSNAPGSGTNSVPIVYHGITQFEAFDSVVTSLGKGHDVLYVYRSDELFSAVQYDTMVRNGQTTITRDSVWGHESTSGNPYMYAFQNTHWSAGFVLYTTNPKDSLSIYFNVDTGGVTPDGVMRVSYFWK